MSEFVFEPPQTRIPLVDRRRRWTLGVASVVILTFLAVLPATVSGWSNPFTLAAHTILCLLFIPVAGTLLLMIFRFRRTTLVMDGDGIWLEGRRRQGLRWEDISGYELPSKLTGPAVRIRGRNGQSLNIPLIFGMTEAPHVETVTRELDRCLGPDGNRPALNVPTGALDARIHHHYGVVPPVEMEPDVVYRYLDPKKLADDATRRTSLMVPLVSIIFPSFVVASRTGFPLGIVFAVSLVIGIWFVAFTTRDLRLARSFEDRFIRRGDEIWRIRKGREKRLPQPASVPALQVLGHPTVAYGKGFFAYRIAPQFLEPDV